MELSAAVPTPFPDATAVAPEAVNTPSSLTPHTTPRQELAMLKMTFDFVFYFLAFVAHAAPGVWESRPVQYCIIACQVALQWLLSLRTAAFNAAADALGAGGATGQQHPHHM
jgi:hypothetical protein